MARKILLADDSVTAQNMGRKILTDAGYEVVTVNNGSAALKKITECKPSVVVLDVYMPGYSGLEVCARIKEGRDTDGIPVLLTVGKLEPFRQEDARRVHADAFIIKPFEATELLAALSKLEAKSGNHLEQRSSDPVSEAKSNKHLPPTMARYEREVADGAPKFGDHDSGWKARLTMPSPGSRQQQPEEEPEIASVSSGPAQNWTPEPSDRPAFSITPIPAETTGSFSGLPNDVTADELAAIAAAAAAIGGGNGDVEVEQAAPRSEVADAAEQLGPAPATFASEPAPQVEAVYAKTGSSAGPVSPQVEAVLTSFAAHPAEAAENKAAAPPREITAALSAAAPAATPVRWVAEELPVDAAESALVLEREMHKAFAAFAAAEQTAGYEPGPVDKMDEPMFARSAPPAIGAPTPFASSEKVHSDSAPLAQQPVKPATTESNASQRASELAKPPAMPFAPLAVEEPRHAVVAFGEPHPFQASQPAAPVEEEVEPQETAASLENDSSSPATETSSLPDGWHELRQPVPPATTSNTADTDQLENFSSEPASAAASIESESAAMAAAAAGDSSSSSASADSTLSSIVDNMLAELKPKLMAELAKKLEKK